MSRIPSPDWYEWGAIANTDADVLVYSETGSGKELVARALHEHSNRRDKHFVAVNCGTVPEHLIKSELCGHEAGHSLALKAGASVSSSMLTAARFFLDEIESMPLSATGALTARVAGACRRTPRCQCLGAARFTGRRRLQGGPAQRGSSPEGS